MSGRQALRRLWQQGLQAAKAQGAQQYAHTAAGGSLARCTLGLGLKAVLPQHRATLLQHGRDVHRAFFTTGMRSAAEAAAGKGAAAGKQRQQRVRAALWTALAWVRALFGGVQAVGRQGGRALEAAGSTPIGKAAQMQIASVWQAHGGKITLAAGVVVVYLLYRVSFATASTFVSFSHNMANYGFLALAAALVLFGYQYLTARHTLNPSRVYQLAMLQLNSHAGVLEVMGAPLKGSDVRAYVVTGRRLYWKGLRPKVAPHRMQIMFPLEGPKKRGLASIEAKKKQGKVKFKLLSVDLPAADGEPSGRLYLVGDEVAYQKGSVLGELRHPFLKALALQDTYQAEDEREAEAEEQAAEREHLQQEQQQQAQPAEEQLVHERQQESQPSAQQEEQQGRQEQQGQATASAVGGRPTASTSIPTDLTSSHGQARGGSQTPPSTSSSADATERSQGEGVPKAHPSSASSMSPEPSAASPTTAASESRASAKRGQGGVPNPAPSAVTASVERTAHQPTPRVLGWRQWLYGKQA